MLPRFARRSMLALTLVVIAVVLMPTPSMAQQEGGVTAIRAGRLIDAEAGTATADQVILVENGRITTIGDAATVTIELNDVNLKRVDALREGHGLFPERFCLAGW